MRHPDKAMRTVDSTVLFHSPGSSSETGVVLCVICAGRTESRTWAGLPNPIPPEYSLGPDFLTNLIDEHHRELLP